MDRAAVVVRGVVVAANLGAEVMAGAIASPRNGSCEHRGVVVRWSTRRLCMSPAGIASPPLPNARRRPKGTDCCVVFSQMYRRLQGRVARAYPAIARRGERIARARRGHRAHRGRGRGVDGGGWGGDATCRKRGRGFPRAPDERTMSAMSRRTAASNQLSSRLTNSRDRLRCFSGVGPARAASPPPHRLGRALRARDVVGAASRARCPRARASGFAPPALPRLAARPGAPLLRRSPRTADASPILARSAGVPAAAAAAAAHEADDRDQF